MARSGTMKPTKTGDPHTIPVPSDAERKREAVRQAVKRSARGNIQLVSGKFVTPKDKDLRNIPS